MSTSLGILVLNPSQEAKYFYELAKYGKNNNMDVFIFTPFDIEPRTLLVTGLQYNFQEDKWEKSTSHLPQFIYDRCFYKDQESIKKYAPIVNWLKNNPTITFLGYGLPNKWDIYQSMMNDHYLSSYQPYTVKVQSSNEIISFLKKNKCCILKPIHGSQGKGVILLQLDKKGLQIKTQRNKKRIEKIFSKKSEVEAWLQKLLNAHGYLLQSFLHVQNEEQQPFDIRILLQKDKNGNWIERGRALRIGEQNGIISNLHGGGRVENYQDWLQTKNSMERAVIEDNLQTILSKLPHRLENDFGHLFELGIDIGIESDCSTWILDCNSKPGHQVVLTSHPSSKEAIYEAPFAFCNHLHSLTKRS